MSKPQLVAVFLALGLGPIALAMLVLGLPGTWLLLASAVIYAWFTGFTVVGWGVLGWLAGLAVLGEMLELSMSAAGTGGVRPSRRVSFGAIVGSIVGAIVGAPFLFGIGALLGALLGAFIGAAVAVASEGGNRRDIWTAGLAAMRGRWLGFLMKVGVTVAMVASWLIAVFR